MNHRLGFRNFSSQSLVFSVLIYLISRTNFFIIYCNLLIKLLFVDADPDELQKCPCYSNNGLGSFGPGTDESSVQ
jgi:hypothetical protein